MRQHSWDAVLLGAMTLIATVNGILADQKVTAVTPQANSAQLIAIDGSALAVKNLPRP